MSKGCTRFPYGGFFFPSSPALFPLSRPPPSSAASSLYFPSNRADSGPNGDPWFSPRPLRPAVQVRHGVGSRCPFLAFIGFLGFNWAPPFLHPPFVFLTRKRGVFTPFILGKVFFGVVLVGGGGFFRSANFLPGFFFLIEGPQDFRRHPRNIEGGPDNGTVLSVALSCSLKIDHGGQLFFGQATFPVMIFQGGSLRPVGGSALVPVFQEIPPLLLPPARVRFHYLCPRIGS